MGKLLEVSVSYLTSPDGHWGFGNTLITPLCVVCVCVCMQKCVLPLKGEGVSERGLRHPAVSVAVPPPLFIKIGTENSTKN